MGSDMGDVAAAALPLRYRIANLLVILLPFVGLAVAVVFAWGRGVSLLDLILFGSLYIATGLGITIGFHRYFTHKSFETSRVGQAILGVLGSMAIEGPLLRWVATHRCHHQHSDSDGDPHSPHSHGAGFINMARGLWQAHVGWILSPGPDDLDRYVVDLKDDPVAHTVSRLFPLWMLLSILLPGVLGGLITMSWWGALTGFIWGGLVRIFFVHHVTWSINSVCHIWGTRPFNSHDHSRNNPIFGVLAFGEGWHNNHHAFPASARHGLQWWQIDTSYMLIKGLSFLGLTWNVRTPRPERVESKRAE